MLDAGGVPCVGDWPAFEPDRVPVIPPGHAGKILQPADPDVRGRLPCGVLVIWMARDFYEQARSQIKLLAHSTGIPASRFPSVPAWAASLERDEPEAKAALFAGAIAPPIVANFENVVAAPNTCARALAVYLAPWYDIDPDRMASAIRPRAPGCAPGLDIELALMMEAQARGMSA